MSDDFTIGQRVATTINLGALWPGALSAPAGSTGTIDSGRDSAGAYGVILDCDPDQMPAGLTADEIHSV